MKSLGRLLAALDKRILITVVFIELSFSIIVEKQLLPNRYVS